MYSPYFLSILNNINQMCHSFLGTRTHNAPKNRKRGHNLEFCSTLSPLLTIPILENQ